MLYFVELSQFSEEDFAQAEELRIQMARSMGRAVRWAEWEANRSSANSWPDITLINAARLDWNQLKCVVNQCTADVVVLTGRQDSLLGLPTLPRVDALDDLLEFITSRTSCSRFSLDAKGADRFQLRHGEGADTTPMPLKKTLSFLG